MASSSPVYSAAKPPFGRLHLDKQSFKCWIEWEGKGIACSALSVNMTTDRDYPRVIVEIPLLYFEVVP